MRYSSYLNEDNLIHVFYPLLMTESLAMDLKSEVTIADYEAVANDFQIVELISGDIIVTPPPSIFHQKIISAVHAQLYLYLQSSNAFVLTAPIGLQISANEVYEPDIVVVSSPDSVTDNYIVTPPLLVIEVLSSSTRHRDWGVKFKKYEAFRIPEYWIIDQVAHKVFAFTLTNQNYKKFAEINYIDQLLSSIILAEFTLDLRKLQL